VIKMSTLTLLAVKMGQSNMHQVKTLRHYGSSRLLQLLHFTWWHIPGVHAWDKLLLSHK